MFQQTYTDLVGRSFALGDLRYQPVRGCARVGDAALAKSQQTANLIAVEPIRTTRPLVEGDVGACDADLPSHTYTSWYVSSRYTFAEFRSVWKKSYTSLTSNRPVVRLRPAR